MMLVSQGLDKLVHDCRKLTERHEIWQETTDLGGCQIGILEFDAAIFFATIPFADACHMTCVGDTMPIKGKSVAVHQQLAMIRDLFQ
eukprot:scaffold23831_cov180-Amphora_coffeaeformis.AAC.10